MYPTATCIAPNKVGGTGDARLALFDDGQWRLVKWHRTRSKRCFNEFVGARSGRLIHAPVPLTEIVNVPRHLIDAYSDLCMATGERHIGITYIRNRALPPGLPDDTQWNYSARETVQRLLGGTMLRAANASALLAWLRIGDHFTGQGEGIARGDNNVLIETDTDGHDLQYWLSDLEATFEHREWGFDGKRLPEVESDHILPPYLHDLTIRADGDARLNDALNRLRDLAVEKLSITQCFRDIPEAWCSAAEQQEALQWTLRRAERLGNYGWHLGQRIIIDTNRRRA